MTDQDTETKHPRDWAKELGTKPHVYAGAAVLGIHGWIDGVLLSRQDYEATIARFLSIRIGG